MWKFRGVWRTTQVKRKMQTIQPGLPYAVVTGGHICKALLPCGVIQEEVHLAECQTIPWSPNARVCREFWWTYYPTQTIPWKTSKLQDWIHHVFLVLWEDFPLGYISSYRPPKPLHAFRLTKLERLPISFVCVNSWENSIQTFPALSSAFHACRLCIDANMCEKMATIIVLVVSVIRVMQPKHIPAIVPPTVVANGSIYCFSKKKLQPRLGLSNLWALKIIQLQVRSTSAPASVSSMKTAFCKQSQPKVGPCVASSAAKTLLTLGGDKWRQRWYTRGTEVRSSCGSETYGSELFHWGQIMEEGQVQQNYIQNLAMFKPIRRQTWGPTITRLGAILLGPKSCASLGFRVPFWYHSILKQDIATEYSDDINH